MQTRTDKPVSSAEVELAARTAEQARLGAFLHRLAEALGVEEEPGGGVAEDRMLQAVADLKARACAPAAGEA